MSQPADKITRCGRSNENYAHQLARAMRLELTDVSCSGATTAHLLGPWAELPPQLDAVTAEVALVTMTIGGNDVGYIGRLISASCAALGGIPLDAPRKACPDVKPPAEQDWQRLELALRRIAGEVRRCAPAARIIFVDYPTILSDRPCAGTPLRREDAAAIGVMAKRLASLTERVARETHSDLLRASRLSSRHGVCSTQPWMNGFPRAGGPRVAVPYHPNLAGMTAVARALQLYLTS